MAIVRAVKSGNWSDTTVWNTGALPTSADDVYSNTFTVTIDTSPTVLSIQTGATTGVTAGGGFQITSGGINLTCTNGATGIVASSTSGCLTINIPVSTSITITSNLRAVATSSAIGIAAGSLGIVNVIGDVYGSTSGGGTGGTGIVNSGAGTVNITGTIYAGVSGTNAAYGVNHNNSVGTVNITGNCYASNNSNYNTNYGIINNSSGVINITGNCYSSSSAGLTPAVYNNSSGTISVVGSLVAYTYPAFVSPNSTSAVNVLTGPFITSSTGINPVLALRWFWANSNVTPTYYQIRTANLATIRPLYTADSVGGNPATSNVRSGTVFGPNSELTGTCAVPPAGSVALGVPVDNTTGTAYITTSDITTAVTTALTSASAVTLNQQTSTLTTPGSIGERLKLSSTVATTAQQLSDALSAR